MLICHCAKNQPDALNIKSFALSLSVSYACVFEMLSYWRARGLIKIRTLIKGIWSDVDENTLVADYGAVDILLYTPKLTKCWKYLMYTIH